MSKEKEPGFFEVVLTLLGLFTGCVIGYEQGELVGAIIGAVLLGGIGKWIGTIADWFIKLAVLILFLMINAAIRQFFWDLLNALLNG